MRLSHLALTVTEDPIRERMYYWLLLEAQGEGGVREHSASQEPYESAPAAFQAGMARWMLHLRQDEDEAERARDPAHP